MGVAGNAWNGEPGHSIAIGSGCIWSKFVFLATRRPGNCMEMLLECLRNPGRRLGIITELSVEDLGEPVGLTVGAGELMLCIIIGSSCIWSEFVFLATRRPGDCMEMLLECLRNPGLIFIVKVFVTVCGRCLMLLRVFEAYAMCKIVCRVGGRWLPWEKFLGDPNRRLERPPSGLGNGEQYAKDRRNSRRATGVLTAVVVTVVGNFKPSNNEQREAMVKGGKMTKVIAVAGSIRREPNQRGESIDGGRQT
eukprot:Gb_16811 [translate_table: standard]